MQCNELVRKIWLWAYDKNSWLSASHIPGKVNCDADYESRQFQTEHEWMLDKDVLQTAIKKLRFEPECDLFATRVNKQFEKYVSWKPEPESFAIDAFSIS